MNNSDDIQELKTDIREMLDLLKGENLQNGEWIEGYFRR